MPFYKFACDNCSFELKICVDDPSQADVNCTICNSSQMHRVYSGFVRRPAGKEEAARRVENQLDDMRVDLEKDTQRAQEYIG